MRNYTGELVKAYYQVWNGNIFIDSREVKVYNVGVDASDDFHYIQLRPESETPDNNKSSFMTRPVIIADIYTTHDGAIDASVVEDIDDQMKQLMFLTVRTTALIITGNFQVVNVKFDNGNYLEGFNGSKHDHRKIIRYTNTINQK